MIQEGKRISQAFILDRHTMPAYFKTDHIRGISIFCAESLKLLFGELRKGYFSFCSARILHLEIAALLSQHLPAEAVKLTAYGFHLGNREHLSSSPPLSGREAGFFFSLSIPMAKGGFGQFSSNFLNFYCKKTGCLHKADSQPSYLFRYSLKWKHIASNAVYFSLTPVELPLSFRRGIFPYPPLLHSLHKSPIFGL